VLVQHHLGRHLLLLVICLSLVRHCRCLRSGRTCSQRTSRCGRCHCEVYYQSRERIVLDRICFVRLGSPRLGLPLFKRDSFLPTSRLKILPAASFGVIRLAVATLRVCLWIGSAWCRSVATVGNFRCVGV